MLALYRDVVGFIRQGLIVTNKSLITLTVKKLRLKTFGFFGVKLKAAKKPSLYFYDGNKLIINCMPTARRNLMSFCRLYIKFQTISKFYLWVHAK